MNSMVVFQQMLVLFAMMAVGYVVYKKQWVDEYSSISISRLVVNVFNPLLVINGVIGKEQNADTSLVAENFKFIILYFIIIIVVGYISNIIIPVKKEEKNLYQLMFTFSNVGFMGIPVISSILGKGCIIYITFYILVYNFLLYTYGVRLAQKGSKVKEKGFTFKKIMNPGVIACIFAIIIYLSKITIPSACITFFDYMGNVTIPLSMMMIGISIARLPIKQIFNCGRLYLFTILKMLIVPVAAALILRNVPATADIFAVFILMLGMPVGSIVTMIAKEYGGDDEVASRGIVLTTLVSIISIPIISLLL